MGKKTRERKLLMVIKGKLFEIRGSTTRIKEEIDNISIGKKRDLAFIA